MTEKWNSGKFCFFVFYVMNIFCLIIIQEKTGNV